MSAVAADRTYRQPAFILSVGPAAKRRSPKTVLAPLTVGRYPPIDEELTVVRVGPLRRIRFHTSIPATITKFPACSVRYTCGHCDDAVVRRVQPAQPRSPICWFVAMCCAIVPARDAQAATAAAAQGR